MQLTTIISSETSRYLKKKSLTKQLPLTDIMEAQRTACDFVDKWWMPTHLKIHYRCSHELAMGRESVAYYSYISNKPSKRQVIIFIDKIVRRLSRTKLIEPYKIYLGGVLVHEFSHVQDYTNRFPIVFKQYQKLKTKEDKLLPNVYDFICEVHAEEECTAFIRQYLSSYRQESMFKLYGELLRKFNSPQYMYHKIMRLINMCRITLGEKWFYKVAFNPPDFDDLSYPQEYVEWLSGI